MSEVRMKLMTDNTRPDHVEEPLVLAEGQGRMGGPLAAGPGGTCVCPSCGYETPHKIGEPCEERACPECDTLMTRKEEKD